MHNQTHNRTAEKGYFGLKLPKDLLEWLQDEANRQGETQSTVIRNLIREKMQQSATQPNPRLAS